MVKLDFLWIIPTLLFGNPDMTTLWLSSLINLKRLIIFLRRYKLDLIFFMACLDDNLIKK